MLGNWFGQARFVWNYYLNERTVTYKETGKGLSYNDNAVSLTQLKKNTGLAWLSECPSQALQQALKHLDSAFKDFFSRGKGYPSFKSKHKSNHSLHFPQGFKIVGNSLTIPKVKKPIKIRLHRSIKGNIRSVTVSRNPAGQYHASILTDDVSTSLPESNNQVGLDLGLKHFIIESNGRKTNSPKALKKGERKLAKLQKRLSKKKKGSNNRYKARIKVAKQHLKITNLRKDFLHKLSTKLINENQVIGIEDLHVKGMVRNHKLAKAISDASWSIFTAMLEYKAVWYGREIKKVDKFFPSSKMCNGCGRIKQDLNLSDRNITCDKCGNTYDRDINAAKNILTFSTVGTTGINACGESASGVASSDVTSYGLLKQEAGRSLAEL